MRGSVADAPPAQERWAALGCRLAQGTAGSPGTAWGLRFQVLGRRQKADDKKMKEAYTGSEDSHQTLLQTAACRIMFLR